MDEEDDAGSGVDSSDTDVVESIAYAEGGGFIGAVDAESVVDVAAAVTRVRPPGCRDVAGPSRGRRYTG